MPQGAGTAGGTSPTIVGKHIPSCQLLLTVLQRLSSPFALHNSQLDLMILKVFDSMRSSGWALTVGLCPEQVSQ